MFSDFRKSLEPLRENARMPVSETIKLPPFPTNCIPPQSPPLIIPNNITELVSALLKPLQEGCDLLQALQWPANTNLHIRFVVVRVKDFAGWITL